MIRKVLGVALLAFTAGAAQASVINLNATIRDFNDTHADFESTGGGLDTDAVMSTLGGDGKPVYNAAGAGSAFHGEANFNQWYNDVSGVNITTTFGLVLDNAGNVNPSVYTYSSNSFFPIDGQLFGNQGRSHNYHFTLETHTTFTYQGGEFFNFTGDDDLWVFINNQLVVDLGGVHRSVSGGVDLDTLGLTAGDDYSLDLFFAERHTTESKFRIDTSIALKQNSVPEPSFLVLLGLGLIGLGYSRRRQA